MRSRSSGSGFLPRLLLLVLDWIGGAGSPARGPRPRVRRLPLGTQFGYLAGPIFPELVTAVRECLLHALRPPGFARCPVLSMSDDRHAGEAGNGVLEYLESLAAHVRPKVGKARNIATRPGKTSDKASANRIGILRHDNRYR